MNSKLSIAFILTLVGNAACVAAAAPPIIDMHMHALPIAEFAQLGGAPPIPHCVPMTDYPVVDSGPKHSELFRSRDLPCKTLASPRTDEEVMRQSLAIMERRNIYAVVSGSLVPRWTQASPRRVLPAKGLQGPGSPPLEEMRHAFAEGGFRAMAEITVQYGGMTPDDPSLAAYWALADELDVPAGIHIGTGPLGAPYLGFDRYRARLHSPLVLEEVLIRHPELRVYIMHAGWPMIDDLLAVLWTHPQVYVDLGAIDWALPRAEFHRYLQRIVDAGFGKRVLFGSDQMVWPEAIDIAIESIETATFLTPEQKRDILFNNAARFLRLTSGQIAAMSSE
jgi:hypothetical protein